MSAVESGLLSPKFLGMVVNATNYYAQNGGKGGQPLRAKKMDHVTFHSPFSLLSFSFLSPFFLSIFLSVSLTVFLTNKPARIQEFPHDCFHNIQAEASLSDRLLEVKPIQKSHHCVSL